MILEGKYQRVLGGGKGILADRFDHILERYLAAHGVAVRDDWPPVRAVPDVNCERRAKRLVPRRRSYRLHIYDGLIANCRQFEVWTVKQSVKSIKFYIADSEFLL